MGIVQPGDETATPAPMPIHGGPPIAREQALRGLDVCSAALEPPGHEMVDRCGQPQLCGCQDTPCVKSRVEVSLDTLCGRSSCPPAKSAEGTALRRELNSCVTDQPRFELTVRTAKIRTKASSRTCTTNRPAEQAAARGRQSLRCQCVCCASWSSTMRAISPAANMRGCKRRESPARQTFSFARRGNSLHLAIFEMPARSGAFENCGPVRHGVGGARRPAMAE